MSYLRRGTPTRRHAPPHWDSNRTELAWSGATVDTPESPREPRGRPRARRPGPAVGPPHSTEQSTEGPPGVSGRPRVGDPDACAEAEKEAVGLLVPLLETHPTTVMIIAKASGGAPIKKGVRRQKGVGPLGLLPGCCPSGPRGGRPSGLSGLPGGCSSLIYSPKRHHEMKVTFCTSSCEK